MKSEGSRKANLWSDGQKSHIRHAMEGVSSYHYDNSGNIVMMMNPNGGKTEYTYDSMKRCVKESIGEYSTLYIYDNRGLLSKSWNARGQETIYIYDAIGRLVKKSDDLGDIFYTYDNNGNLLSVSDSNGMLSYTYDSMDRLISQTDTKGNVITYRYNEMGNQTAIVYPDGNEVRYEYYGDGSLKSVTASDGGTTSYEYDATGKLIKTTRPNGTMEERAYDVAGQLVSITESSGDSIFQSYVYTYDETGNIICIETKDGDDTSALKTESVTMTYDENNHLLSYNGEQICYDEDGNMTYGPLDGRLVEFVYDCRNRLVQAGDIHYIYDAMDNRIASVMNGTVTEYVTDNSQELSRVLIETSYNEIIRTENTVSATAPEKTEITGNVVTYVYGNGLISQNSQDEQLFYHYNHLGSTTKLTDKNGSEVAVYNYGTYGELLSSNSYSIAYLYNGQYGVRTDANGLYYMRARYYNTDISRFMNRDVIEGSIAEY